MIITYTVYCLYSRKEDVIFYVGATRRPLKTRKYAHLNDAILWNGLNPIKNAMIIALGCKFNIRILEKTYSRPQANRLETLYIKRYIRRGSPLVNISKNPRYGLR